MRRDARAEIERDVIEMVAGSRRTVGATFLEAGDLRIAEIPAARALREVAAERRHMPDLRRGEALRGGGDGVSVIDYADGSLTQAPHPARHGVRIFSLVTELGTPYSKENQAIADHRTFIDAACANFGVESLRQLPDAVNRVVQWVEARRSVGDETAPDPDTARRWVHFCESETLRSLAAAKALRSRRANDLFTLLNSPSEPHNLATPEAVVALARERGAVAARPAATGTSNAVIAFVPVQEADAFVETMAKDFEVVEVTPGEVARREG